MYVQTWSNGLCREKILANKFCLTGFKTFYRYKTSTDNTALPFLLSLPVVSEVF